MGQKVNGISVSETPKIGERPYPQPFHPVEITPKFTQNQQNNAPRSQFMSYLRVTNPQICAQIVGKSSSPGLRNSSLEIGTRTLEGHQEQIFIQL